MVLPKRATVSTWICLRLSFYGPTVESLLFFTIKILFAINLWTNWKWFAQFINAGANSCLISFNFMIFKQIYRKKHNSDRHCLNKENVCFQTFWTLDLKNLKISNLDCWNCAIQAFIKLLLVGCMCCYLMSWKWDDVCRSNGRWEL